MGAAGAPGPALVVLAAGASRRLGSCKALVDIRGRTPLERLLDAGAALGDPAPLVVSGADDAAIRAWLARSARAEVELAHNAAWRRGRSGSAAVAAAARPGRDLCLAPVDVPLVPGAVFAALRRAWEQAGRPERGWLAPRATAAEGGPPRHGHPVVLGRALAAELAALEPDAPLRDLRARARPLLAAPVDAPEVLDDLDTPADLERLRAR